MQARFLTSALAITLLALTGCNNTPVRNSAADYQRNLDRQLTAATLRTVTIECGPGRIEIVGQEGLRSIEFEGMVSAHAENGAEAKRIGNEVRLQVQAEGTENPIVRVIEPMLASGGQWYTYDVVVRVPSTVQVTVKDTTGDVEVGGLASGLQLSSTDGFVSVGSVHGGLIIESGGADTKIRDVSGHLQVADGPGRLEISNVTGDIDITDGGGPLVVTAVSGNVTARDNPQGAELRNIDGDVTLIRISPASSKIQGVTGALSYPLGSE